MDSGFQEAPGPGDRDGLRAQHVSPEGVGSKEGHIEGLLLREVAQGDEHGVGEPHVSRHLQPNEPIARRRLIRVQYLARVKELDPKKRVCHSPDPLPSYTGTPRPTPGHPGGRGTWSGQKQQESTKWKQKQVEEENTLATRGPTRGEAPAMHESFICFNSVSQVLLSPHFAEGDTEAKRDTFGPKSAKVI